MKIRVELEQNPYDVFVGYGVRATLAGEVATLAPRARVVVVITTPSLRHQPWFDFSFDLPTHVLEAPDGESGKNLATVERLCTELAELGVSRHDLIVSVGGGATTDLAGFVAAVYLRGVAVCHVATSIAGQVDAAIGGKTAVDLTLGKNLVGAFHQPRAVWCDLDTLETLSTRERIGGMGEVAKCWLLEGRTVAALATTSLESFVAMAVALKADVVARDERETTGERALLNYGHTFAHAVELLALARDPDALRHGEAVALGLGFEARLAHRLGRVDANTVSTTDAVTHFFGLPAALPFVIEIDDVLAAMARDKKAHHNLTFVLPGSGGFDTVANVSADDVRATYAEFIGGKS